MAILLVFLKQPGIEAILYVGHDELKIILNYIDRKLTINKR